MLVPDLSFLPELWDTHSQKPFAGASREEVLTFQNNLSVSHPETNFKKRTIIISLTFSLQNYCISCISIRFWSSEYHYFLLNFLVQQSFLPLIQTLSVTLKESVGVKWQRIASKHIKVLNLCQCRKPNFSCPS